MFESHEGNSYLGDFIDQFASNSQESLREQILRAASRSAVQDRKGMVSELGAWIGERNESRVKLASYVAGHLQLHELREPLHNLMLEIDSGSIFANFSSEDVRVDLARMDRASDNQSFYRFVDNICVRMQRAGLDAEAGRITFLLHEVAWTTTSELFQELLACFKSLVGTSDANTLPSEIRTDIELCISVLSAVC